MKFKPTNYQLVNVGSGRIFQDAGWTLADPEASAPSLVRAVYENEKFTPRDDLKGLYRYAEWLPINRTLKIHTLLLPTGARDSPSFSGWRTCTLPCPATFQSVVPRWRPALSRRPRRSLSAQGCRKRQAHPCGAVRRQHGQGFRSCLLRQRHSDRDLHS